MVRLTRGPLSSGPGGGRRGPGVVDTQTDEMPFLLPLPQLLSWWCWACRKEQEREDREWLEDWYYREGIALGYVAEEPLSPEERERMDEWDDWEDIHG